MRLRDRLDSALQDYEDINLASQAARDALIDRIIWIVQNEPTDSKYWTIKEHPLAQFEAVVDDDGNVIQVLNEDEIVHPD